MRTRPDTIPLVIACLVAALAVSAQARRSSAAQPPSGRSALAQSTSARAAPVREPRIEIEVALESGLSPTAAHDWHKILTDLKVDSVRIRSSKPTDKPEITATGNAASQSYRVTARLGGGNTLTVPGGRFQTSDRAGLAAWLKKLREEGPDRAAGGRRLPFGLTKEQFLEVGKDLSQPVQFSTLDQSPTAILGALAKSLKIPLAADKSTVQLLKTSPAVDVELRGMTAGTVAAYALEGAGLALAPRAERGQALTYTIISADSKEQRWPIGLPPERPKPELAPDMFETIEVELDEIELSTLLETIGERTRLPILVDHRSLAKANIDLDKTVVSLPKKKLVYASILDRTLGPKFLEHEIRVDDAGKPFVYIRAVRAGAALAPRASKSKGTAP